MNSQLIKVADNADPQRSQTIEGATAGLFLLLATIASGAMVWTRLQANIDQPTFEETLIVIDENLVWYHWHGAIRILFGSLLIAAGSIIRLAMVSSQGWQLRISVVLLNLGGIAMVVSGALIIFVGLVYWTNIYNVEQFDSYRALAGSISNTTIGLAIILMTPIQWRLGGMMKLLGGLAPFTGLGMIIVWWDALSVHQISGVLFLLWMLGTSIGLILGRFGHQVPDNPHLASGHTRKFKA